MDDLRAVHVERERAAWARFEALVNGVPRDRWDDPSVLHTWTLQEVLWHVAGWLRKCAESLDAMRQGRFVDEDMTDEQVDERNASLAAEARGMEPDLVWAGVLEAREEVLRQWSALPRIDQAAVEELAIETYEHYEEHLPDLEAFGR